MRRRDFITLLGGAAATWPMVARAQQAAVPVIGLLSNVAPNTFANLMPAFRQALNEAGFLEGQNVALDYRWAVNQRDLPAVAVGGVHPREALPRSVRRHGDPRGLRQVDGTRSSEAVFLLDLGASLIG